jgi:hypothetical protein
MAGNSHSSFITTTLTLHNLLTKQSYIIYIENNKVPGK